MELTYTNFDVQSTTPAPIYVLFRKGESAPVAGQPNIVDVIPGDPGHNDFWHRCLSGDGWRWSLPERSGN